MKRLFIMRQLQHSGKRLLNTLNPLLLFLFIWCTDLKAFVCALDNKEAFFPLFIRQRLQERKTSWHPQSQIKTAV